MSRPNVIHCPAVLALELTEPRSKADALPRDRAPALASAVANDLARLLPGVDTLGMSLAAAGYDPAELLRPAWPIFSALADMYRDLLPPAAEPAAIAFGAHAGNMPRALLDPDPKLIGSPLMVVPFTLIGTENLATEIATRMEQVLIERGAASPPTIAAVEGGFQVKVTHARYLTRHDLCALVSVQYEHAGLAPLWQLIEAALFSPEGEQEALSGSGQPYLYCDGRVLSGTLDFAAWSRTPLAPPSDDSVALKRGYAAWQIGERQYAAILAAHGIVVESCWLTSLPEDTAEIAGLLRAGAAATNTPR